jgi:LPS-assembly protein
MKNKIIVILLMMLLIHPQSVYSNEFTFDAESIISEKSINGEQIIKAKNGTAKSMIDKAVITSEFFRFNKKKSELEADNGLIKFLETGIDISAKKLLYNSLLSNVLATGDVDIVDNKQKLFLKSQNIFFDNKNQIIRSKTKSLINDRFGNTIEVDSFNYSLNNNLIKINQAILTDIDNNVFNIEKAYINLLSGKLIGKDISINFNNRYLDNSGDPRLKGSTIESTKEKTTITKGIFTNCKKNDSCPPWQISAKKIEHDKKNKIIYYDNAWLKIYDKPVMYFPKFFHPDPTVKRQSGFLMPSFNSSTSIGSSLSLPYFKVLADNKDLTISPRLYKNDKILNQLEYRELNADTKYNMDLSLLTEKNAPSKSHLFINAIKKFNFEDFSESNLNFNLQTSSNDTYLKTYKIDSPIISTPSFLTSSLDFNAYKDDFSFDSSVIVFEDLNKKNNDRYEVIYPTFNVNKDIINDSALPGNFNINSFGLVKSYDTNTLDKVFINDLMFNSDSFLTNSGIKNDFKLLFKNINTDSKNSKKYKNKQDIELASIIQFNSSYPLKNIDNSFINIFKPISSFKFSPNRNKKKLREKDKRIDVNNAYNLNRISSNDMVEGGGSLTYGLEYKKNRISDSIEVFDAKIANVIRIEENKNLPTNNNVGGKTSDILGSLAYSGNDFFKTNYEFSINDNLKDTSYQLLGTEFKVNNFITSFEYLNENSTNDSDSYLSNKTSYNFNDSKNISFETRKNKKTNMTEFYNLIYQYRNDCLIAAIEYNRDYYNDRDLQPEENIFFKLTIVPFGQTSSPNLK